MLMSVNLVGKWLISVPTVRSVMASGSIPCLFTTAATAGGGAGGGRVDC